MKNFSDYAASFLVFLLMADAITISISGNLFRWGRNYIVSSISVRKPAINI